MVVVTLFYQKAADLSFPICFSICATYCTLSTLYPAELRKQMSWCTRYRLKSEHGRLSWKTDAPSHCAAKAHVTENIVLQQFEKVKVIPSDAHRPCCVSAAKARGSLCLCLTTVCLHFIISEREFFIFAGIHLRRALLIFGDYSIINYTVWR